MAQMGRWLHSTLRLASSGSVAQGLAAPEVSFRSKSRTWEDGPASKLLALHVSSVLSSVLGSHIKNSAAPCREGPQVKALAAPVEGLGLVPSIHIR